MTAHCNDDMDNLSIRNIVNAIDLKRALPDNVFSSDWKWFLFFDSDLIFKSSFVAIVSSLLAAEGGTVACLTNIDEALQKDSVIGCSLFLGASTTGADYLSLVAAGGPSQMWAFGVGCFGVISDVGNWAIYCDGNNEIAVIAFRDCRFLEKVRPILSQLYALPIEEAIAMPQSYGYSVLPEDWRERFVKSYGSKSKLEESEDPEKRPGI